MGIEIQATHSSLMQHLERLANVLRKEFPKALSGTQDEAVHDSRVATRRLSAAIKFLKPHLADRPRKRLSKSLRRIRRVLGPLRDLDVMLAHLRETPPRDRHARAGEWLREQLAVQREQLCRKIERGTSGVKLLIGLHEISGFESALLAGGAGFAQELRRRLGDELAEFDRQAGSLLKEGDSASRGTPAHPHSLRIAGKLLRYTLELAGVLSLPVPGSLGKKFKRLQDALGAWHDCLVLSQAAVRLAIDMEVATVDPALYGQLVDLSLLFWKRSEQRLHHFVSLWQEMRAAVLEDVQWTVSEEAAALAGEAPASAHPGEPPMSSAPEPEAKPAVTEPQSPLDNSPAP